MGKATNAKRTRNAKSNGVSNANTGAAFKARVATLEAATDAKTRDAIAHKTFTAQQSRGEVAGAIKALIGNVRDHAGASYHARYNVGRRAFMLGHMAATFARAGDNREPDALFAHAAEVLDCAKPDAAKVADGQRRCTEAEWKARGACRTAWSALCGDFGIAVPKAAGGGANNRTGKASTGNAKPDPEKVVAKLGEASQAAVKALVAKAKRDANKASKEALAFAPPSTNDIPAFVAWVQSTSLCLLQKADKVNAKTKGAVPLAYRAAIDDFAAAIKAAAAE